MPHFSPEFNSALRHNLANSNLALGDGVGAAYFIATYLGCPPEWDFLADR